MKLDAPVAACPSEESVGPCACHWHDATSVIESPLFEVSGGRPEADGVDAMA
jgi:hypothetical protein